MKVAFISDIHGNYPALEAVLADIENEMVDQVYCLGDLVGYYCMFNEVIGMMKKKNIPGLIGNHDYALMFNKGVIERSKTCTRILARQLEEISEENLAFLQGLKKSFDLTVGNKRFHCVHGGLGDPIDEYIGAIDEDYFKKHSFEYDVLVSGHTHMPRNEKIGNKRYLNPGSVGQPRDGQPSACYLLVSEEEYRHKRVDYDIEKITGEMKKQGYEPYIYEILYKGVKIGQ